MAVQKSKIEPSRVPAFMASAPPMVAGMPARHSSPPMSRAAASRMSPESDMPAPTATSSPWNSARLRIPPSFSTMPWIVWSEKSTLLPPPNTISGSPSWAAKASA